MSKISNCIKSTNLWKNINSDNNSIDFREYSESVLFKHDKSILKDVVNKLALLCNISTEHVNPDIVIKILLVYSNPDIFLSNKKNLDKKLILVERATELYNYIKTDNFNYKQVGKKIFTFKIMYDNYKNIDQDEYFKELCKMYTVYTNRINKYKNDSNKKEFVNKMTGFIIKIEKELRSINPEFKEFVKQDNKLNNNISRSINFILKKKYWQNLENQINFKKNFKVVNDIIADYQEMLTELDVSYNSVDHFNKYKNIYTFTNIINTIIAIINYNKEIDDVKYYKQYTRLLNEISKDDSNIIDFLKICFDRMEILCDNK